MTLQKRIERLLKHTTPIKIATVLEVSLATVYRWRAGKTIKAHPAVVTRLTAYEQKVLG